MPEACHADAASPALFLGALLVMFLGGLWTGRFSNANGRERRALEDTIDGLLELAQQPPCLVCGKQWEGSRAPLARTFSVCVECQPATLPALEKLRRESA